MNREGEIDVLEEWKPQTDPTKRRKAMGIEQVWQWTVVMVDVVKYRKVGGVWKKTPSYVDEHSIMVRAYAEVIDKESTRRGFGLLDD